MKMISSFLREIQLRIQGKAGIINNAMIRSISLQVVQETLKERVLPAHIFCAGMVSLMAKGEQYKVRSVCVSISSPFLTSISLSIDDLSPPVAFFLGFRPHWLVLYTTIQWPLLFYIVYQGAKVDAFLQILYYLLTRYCLTRYCACRLRGEEEALLLRRALLGLQLPRLGHSIPRDR